MLKGRSQPMVSVVMASFNHERFVVEAVKSVLAQSLDNLELIVVDDASNDQTPDLVASIADKRLRLVRLPINRGIQVRNLGLGLARGRYIAFQNSDDVWHVDKLAKQVEVMEANLDMTACFTGVALIDEYGGPKKNTWADNLFTLENRSPKAWLRHFFDFGNCLALPSALVRRTDLVELGGFCGSLVQLSDIDLWVRLAGFGNFLILQDQLTHLRIVDGLNLSAPSKRVSRRYHIELMTVLERFTAPKLLERYPFIFPDLVDSGKPGARKVALALRALQRHGSAGLMFADRVITNVLDDEIARADALESHGPAFIHEFFERRCNMEIIISEAMN